MPADHRFFPQGPGQPALKRQGPEEHLGRGECSLGFPQLALLALQDSQIAQGVAFAVCVARALEESDRFTEALCGPAQVTAAVTQSFAEVAQQRSTGPAIPQTVGRLIGGCRKEESRGPNGPRLSFCPEVSGALR
ncbi:hypothetical protein [Streptomyces mirabilis]|uniref:hypothetical protein n=1 Tax=Streptomyces mirabilis TaxID=68239 RepID=UPI0036CE1D4B